ncbi:hypothetical protein WJT74_09790 [Sphingomicrobium sp. XHP0239]|uniref:hypothetical protein n=1 Tax=Sphingomicrobium maritimum TaxID=3133972 RepID=UPI0031CCBB21
MNFFTRARREATRIRSLGTAANRQINRSSYYTDREIEASIQALNIFFGAVIGISLAGIEEVPMISYLAILVMTAAVVMMILMVSNSHRRLWHAVSMVTVLGLLWWVAEIDPADSAFIDDMPDRLLPTLTVWAAMALLTEFAPRVSPED